MTFRDDHDAALARADALERELETAKETADDAEAALAKANLDKARLEAEVAELRAKQATPPEPKAEPTPPALPEPPASPKVSGGPLLMLVAMVALIALIAALSTKKKKRSEAPPNPTCTLVTEPPGATIYALRRDRMFENLGVERNLPRPGVVESSLGITPLSMSRDQWIMEGVIGDQTTFEARLEGYVSVPVAPPLEGMGCSSTVYRLDRR